MANSEKEQAWRITSVFRHPAVNNTALLSEDELNSYYGPQVIN
jgi:hypothetical protein